MPLCQALSIASNEPCYADIADNTRGVLFFGTPHRGSDAARWGSIVAGIAQSAGGVKPRSLFLCTLKPNSDDLINLTEDFRHIAHRYAIVSFVEQDAVSGLGRVVSAHCKPRCHVFAAFMQKRYIHSANRTETMRYRSLRATQP